MHSKLCLYQDTALAALEMSAQSAGVCTHIYVYAHMHTHTHAGHAKSTQPQVAMLEPGGPGTRRDSSQVWARDAGLLCS